MENRIKDDELKKVVGGTWGPQKKECDKSYDGKHHWRYVGESIKEKYCTECGLHIVLNSVENWYVN